MLKIIRMIIARKCVERKAPLVATGNEVFRISGKGGKQQFDEVLPLIEHGVVQCGRTLNDIYYKLKDTEL